MTGMYAISSNSPNSSSSFGAGGQNQSTMFSLMDVYGEGIGEEEDVEHQGDFEKEMDFLITHDKLCLFSWC